MKKMEMRIFKAIRNGLCCMLVTGMVACSGTTTNEAVNSVESDELGETGVDTGAEGVETWDNNTLNSNFATTDYYENWDANDDNQLDENEYNTGFYDTWDTNDDKKIDENEWNAGAKSYGMNDETWGGWNTTNDNYLDEKEFRTGMTKKNYYQDWDVDKDKKINEREYTDGVFGLWDLNDDGKLDTDEYAGYNTYFRS